MYTMITQEVDCMQVNYYLFIVVSTSMLMFWKLLFSVGHSMLVYINMCSHSTLVYVQMCTIVLHLFI